jgi:two-component system NtrC family sensor kinase
VRADGEAQGGEGAPDRLLRTILGLASRVAAVPQKEDELIRLFADAVVEAFPGVACCIRTFDAGNGTLTGAYAVGTLDKDRRDALFVTPGAFEGGAVPAEIREKLSPFVQVVDEAPCIFSGSATCHVVALVGGRELFGTLHVELTGGGSLGPTDRLFLSVLGGMLAGAVAQARSLRELRYLRDYMNQLIDHANVPIIVLDREHRVKSFNQAMESITGYAREDIAGSDFFSFLGEHDRQRFLPVLLNAFQGRSTAGFEVHIPRKEGRDSVPMALNIAPVTDIHGETEDAVVIGQDLTEVRRLQNQMLHTERLVTIGQLSAGVVHEINNPLTSISVYSDYLLKKYDKQGMDPADLQRLKRIVVSADRILKFTRDLMSFARPTPEEPSLVDLREVVVHAVGFCEHIIARHAITTQKDFPEHLPPVYGIKAQLQQVMVNLITNACHAMKETGGELRMRVRDNGDGTISLDVEDTGVGMPHDVASRVFEPFFSTKPEGEGTGLGLSIVKNIIDNHQGRVTIASAVGKGTTVTLTLYTLE